MRKPELLSVIAAAADSKPRVITNNGKQRLHPDAEERVYKKIAAVSHYMLYSLILIIYLKSLKTKVMML